MTAVLPGVKFGEHFYGGGIMALNILLGKKGYKSLSGFGIVGPPGPRGDKGDKGDTGQKGSQWYTGTAITGSSTADTIFPSSGLCTAYENDMYLNTDNGRLYQCTAGGTADQAKWVFRVRLGLPAYGV